MTFYRAEITSHLVEQPVGERQPTKENTPTEALYPQNCTAKPNQNDNK